MFVEQPAPSNLSEAVSEGPFDYERRCFSGWGGATLAVGIPQRVAAGGVGPPPRHRAADQLADNPEMGGKRDYVREGYRVLLINSQAVYYTAGDTTIQVVRVLHGRTDPSRQL